MENALKTAPDKETFFQEFQNVQNNFEQLMKFYRKRAGLKGDGDIYVKAHFFNTYLVNKNMAKEKDYHFEVPGIIDLRNITNLLFCDNDGTCWYADLDLTIDRYSGSPDACPIRYKIGKWKACNKILKDYIIFNTRAEVVDAIKKKSKWLYQYLEEKKDTNLYTDYPEYLLMAPEIEQLDKAGYEFVHEFFYGRYRKNIAESFNRLCKPGKNLKEIFKTSKPIYQAMKDNRDLELWDTLRKMDKKDKIGYDVAKDCIDYQFTKKEIDNIYSVLSREFHGKPVFTWKSLLNYLERLDNFEAIDRQEALEILSDYLIMCQRLDMKPRVDGDSLKREHDIAARLCLKRKDELTEKAMVSACEKLKKYDYSEDIFFIRGIRSYDDLLDEAKRQHNCVAGYADRIISGKSLIYVMREKAHPENSLITVELSPSGKEIRQKYMSYNRPIRNKAQTEFLQRWMKHVAAVKSGKNALEKSA